MAPRVLVFHRDLNSTRSNQQMLDSSGFQCEIAATADEAVKLLGSHPYQLLLLDQRHGPADSQPESHPGPGQPVVAVTTYDTLSAAVTALTASSARGAAENAVADPRLLLRSLGFFDERLPATAILSGMVGESSALKEALVRSHRAARSEASILLYGESGTGKELAATAIHNASSRHANPFVTVDCAALPENLLEAELFGYEKGAFTGALKTKPGLMELADHGTLFLDEVGEIPITLQAKLLRALQENAHRRLGGTGTVEFDARIIAATNRDLPECVKQGTFREDLFFRLNVIPVRLPALRERAGDIPLIARYVLEKYCERDTGTVKTLDNEVLEAFQRYAWPGNVRELENVVRRMCIMAEGTTVTTRELPAEILDTANEYSRPAVTDDGVVWSLTFMEARRRHLNQFEEAYLRNLLERCTGNISRAAEAADVDRKTFYRLLRKHDLQRPLLQDRSDRSEQVGRHIAVE